MTAILSELNKTSGPINTDVEYPPPMVDVDRESIREGDIVTVRVQDVRGAECFITGPVHRRGNVLFVLGYAVARTKESNQDINLVLHQVINVTRQPWEPTKGWSDWKCVLLLNGVDDWADAVRLVRVPSLGISDYIWYDIDTQIELTAIDVVQEYEGWRFVEGRITSADTSA